MEVYHDRLGSGQWVFVKLPLHELFELPEEGDFYLRYEFTGNSWNAVPIVGKGRSGEFRLYRKDAAVAAAAAAWKPKPHLDAKGLLLLAVEWGRGAAAFAGGGAAGASLLLVWVIWRQRSAHRAP